MQFSIVTPSFRSGQWLKLCVASVADQKVELEHIVQDSCSDDGTQDWLPNDPRVKAFIEKDGGMYDAINRGLRRSKGEWLAHLNSDEQYLPGALARVADYFTAHPTVEVVFTDTVVVDEQGRYICDRQALVPHEYHSMVSGNLSYLTAGTFFRRNALEAHHLFFNADRRSFGDVDWALHAIREGVRMKVLPVLTSVFTETGENLSRKENHRIEGREVFEAAPRWVRAFRLFIVAHFRLRRLLAGHYAPKAHEYAIYTLYSPDRRRTFQVKRPTYRWVR